MIRPSYVMLLPGWDVRQPVFGVVFVTELTCVMVI